MGALAKIRSQIVLAFSTGAWTATGAIASRLALVVSSFIAAKQFGQAAFADFAVVQSTVAVLVLLGSLGLGLTVSKRIRELEGNAVEIGRTICALRSTALLLSSLAAAVLMLGSQWVAQRVLLRPELNWELSICSLQVFFSSLSVLDAGIFFGLRQVATQAKCQLFGALVGLLFVAVLSGMDYGMGPYVGMVIGAASSAGTLRVYSNAAIRRANIPVSMGFKTDLKLLKDFSVPLTLSSLLVTPTMWICNLALLRSPTGPSAVASFNVGWQWFSMIAFLPSIAAQVVVPLLSQYLMNGDVKRTKWFVSIATALSGGLSALVVVPALIWANAIVGAYGLMDEGSVGSFRLLLCSSVIAAFAAPLGHVVLAANRAWAGFGMNLVWSLIVVTGSVLCQKEGAMGLSWVMMVAYVALALYASFYVREHIFRGRGGAIGN